MILIANDVGSKTVSWRGQSLDMPSMFRAKGYPCRVEELAFGDFVFSGYGPPVEVGGEQSMILAAVERKTLGDLISSMQTGRLADHQIPGILEYYEYGYLLVEGIYREGPDTGYVEVLQGGKWATYQPGGKAKPISYETVENYLISVEAHTPIRVVSTNDPAHTVRTVGRLYQWFQKDWNSHRSFKTAYRSGPSVVQFWKPDEKRSPAEVWRKYMAKMFAKELPGIGWDKSELVAERFGSVEGLVLASVGDWLDIKGIGKGTVDRIMYAMREWEMGKGKGAGSGKGKVGKGK